ncbi:hypothetical protein H1R20_g7537, partial [Candolleomyces eurysporus]
MKLFEVGGSLQDNVYLFLGDYVDRGDFGIECLMYLYALKIWSPTRVVLLRGNHECRHLTEYFTFKKECLHKYSEKVYEACIQSFCALPVAALVDHRFFCVHGGISPNLVTLADLQNMNRFQEPGSQGLLCDLLWADPITNYGHETEHSHTGAPLPATTSFIPNATRGCSFFYTFVPSHSVFPPPQSNLMLWFWSVTDMLLAVLSVCSEEELDTDSDDEAKEVQAAEEITKRREQIKNKIRAVGRMQRVFTLLREESESATELAVAIPSEGALPNQLAVNGAKISKSIHSFEEARKSDIANERLPEFERRPDMFPAPSMRLGGRDVDAGSLDTLIRRTLAEEREGEDDNEDALVEKVAERLAKGRTLGVGSRPAALKRYGTT